MHPEMAGVLAGQRYGELTQQAARRHAAVIAREAAAAAPRRRTMTDVHLPRYRVHWSRTTLSPVGPAGRPERSWVIVISATRGL